MRRDVLMILSCGRRAVMRCLLALQEELRASEVFYFMNELFVDDYCVWIQQIRYGIGKAFIHSQCLTSVCGCSDEFYVPFVRETLKTGIGKADMDWPLSALEDVAQDDE